MAQISLRKVISALRNGIIAVLSLSPNSDIMVLIILHWSIAQLICSSIFPVNSIKVHSLYYPTSLLIFYDLCTLVFDSLQSILTFMCFYNDHLFLSFSIISIISLVPPSSGSALSQSVPYIEPIILTKNSNSIQRFSIIN